MSGYSERELEDIQGRWKLRFPPDLIATYRKRRMVILRDDFDWIRTPAKEIRRCIEWPIEGLLVGSSRVDLQACKLEYSIVSPK